jgi:hypothetical protein
LSSPNRPQSADWRPFDPDRLPDLLVQRIAATPGWTRVAVDGPNAAGPHELAESLIDGLRAVGRPVEHVRAETFWRDASLRLEYGHTDAHSFRHEWLDVDALTREVLAPLGVEGRGSFLTSLRDPLTNRASRRPPVVAQPGQVVLISGELLLGRGLTFDLTIHLAMSAAALARRTPPELAWTLPAFDGYDYQADVVIKVDDPRHPALRLN